jgi:HD-GYP domain-containing protein (c-di-GMP phosphodiesterase class II)
MLGSMKLKDDWKATDESVFQDDDGRQERAPRETDEDASKLRRELKLQGQGKQIVSTLYMLVRNVKLHQPDNAIFLKPIDTLREAMNMVIASERSLNLQAAGTTIYLNNAQLRFDFSALESVQFLTKEFERRDIGGFSTTRPVTSQEIRNFLYVFSGDNDGAAAEEGAPGHELPSMRLARYAQVKELLDKLQAEPDLDQQIDRKKYLMTVYARAVFFMKKYFEKIQKGDNSIPFAKAGRIVQDIIDLCHDQRSHFLGVTTTKSDTDYLPYHSVNTTLLAVIFGAELGLDKRQIHELGMAALFSQIGLVGMPEELLGRRGGLSEEERRAIDLFPLRSAKKILFSRGLDKSTMMRIVATYESKVDYAIPRRMADGEIELVMPKLGLGIYGKVIAICECYDALTSRRPFREAYGPEIALALMSSEIKYKFDPVLLRVFMKVMAIQPVKILEQGQSIRIG